VLNIAFARFGRREVVVVVVVVVVVFSGVCGCVWCGDRSARERGRRVELVKRLIEVLRERRKKKKKRTKRRAAAPPV
jgi:hypothetical protein